MPMNKTVLGKALADLVISPDAPADMKTKITKQWTDIADAIISHISQNATITVAAGIPVSTTGSATAQTGATTSTGTATIA
jgi:hypothetical protein